MALYRQITQVWSKTKHTYLNLVYDRPNSFKQSPILGIKQLKEPNFLLEENQKSHFKIDFMPLVSFYIPW